VTLGGVAAAQCCASGGRCSGGGRCCGSSAVGGKGLVRERLRAARVRDLCVLV
jgi:hypothetical protein